MWLSVFGALSNHLFLASLRRSGPFRTESLKAAAVTIVFPKGTAKIARGRYIKQASRKAGFFGGFEVR